MRIPFQIVLLLLLGSLPAAAQTSTWWYPLGNLGATRSNPDSTQAQGAGDLVVKWKSTKLKNSPTILVGALSGIGTAQQVVGLEGSRVVILSSTGRLVREKSLAAQFGTSATLTLTGLFDVTAPTPLPQGRPTHIGIGVDRRAPDVGNPFALIIDGNLEPVWSIPVSDVPRNGARPGNESVGIYPVAAYRPPTTTTNPIAITLVSQNSFVGTGSPTDTMINGLRRYDLPATAEAGLIWRYPIATRTYPQSPAFASLGPQADASTYIGISTSSYGFTPPITITPPDEAPIHATTSSRMYSLNVRVNDPVRADPLHTQPMPPDRAALGEAHTYIVRLINSESDPNPEGWYYRIATENYGSGSPGMPRMTIASVDTADSPPFDSIPDPGFRDLGWTVVTADLDGPPNCITPATDLPFNRGQEIVAAHRSLDGSDLQDNWLYGIRLNRQSLVTDRNQNKHAFGIFTRQPFSGRLMAAGDLVAENGRKDEIVTASNNTLRIHQMVSPCTNSRVVGFDPDQRRLFDVIGEITLGSRILSVAIADLEGDGENDIIVSTEDATYAIGKVPTDPFGVVSASTADVCQGDTVRIEWTDRKGGGERGVRLLARGQGEPVEIVVDTADGAPDSLVTTALPPGTYQLSLQDTEVPAISQPIAGTLVVRPAAIAPLQLVTSTPVEIGDEVRLTSSAECLRALALERSYDGQTWEPVPAGEATVTFDGVDASVATTVVCPSSAMCGGASQLTIRYRLTGANGSVVSEPASVPVPVPEREITITPDDSSRSQRLIVWANGDFTCDSVVISLRTNNGWTEIARIPNAPYRTGGDSGVYLFAPQIELSGEIDLRVCCHESAGSCEFGLSRLSLARVDEGSFVAPNPFDPTGIDGSATIVYSLNRQGAVDVTIYDASRSVVRTLLLGVEQEEGAQDLQWDGQNSRGEIVANGTYICVVQSSSGERIILPVIVRKR